MKITNTSKGPRGINTKAGQIMLEPGQTVDDVELADAEAKIAKATGWFDFSGKAKAEASATALKAEHAGGGAYFIMDGDKKVGESMKKEDADAFNALSDEDKAAFVKKG
jgi:hypothetical protein